MLSIFISFALGGIFGMSVMACCTMASRADEDMESYEKTDIS